MRPGTELTKVCDKSAHMFVRSTNILQHLSEFGSKLHSRQAVRSTRVTTAGDTPKTICSTKRKAQRSEDDEASDVYMDSDDDLPWSQ